MDPLANTDLQTYIRDLVDRHLPDKDRRETDATTRPKNLPKRSDDNVTPTGKEKDKRVEKV